jgi:hypothetical protein
VVVNDVLRVPPVALLPVKGCSHMLKGEGWAQSRFMSQKDLKNKLGIDSAECCCRVFRRIISNIHIEFLSKAGLDLYSGGM